MSPRALITGVGGQDGALLAALLVEEGYEVAGVVRRDPSEYVENLADVAGRIEFVRADAVPILGPLDLGQLLCLAMTGIGVVLWWWRQVPGIAWPREQAI